MLFMLLLALRLLLPVCMFCSTIHVCLGLLQASPAVQQHGHWSDWRHFPL